ncbi:hypothetical protein CJ030_MR3G014594 [Morella rubra]|uniref:Myb/SANT-like domain-containing protein n=1 Tax=Morella rubra TaxID=262757 RepID=A0A6A1W0Z4_9ROSI|nr:hypothetical protein CJ030_MR3G014594 [Morella rubra]
MASSKTLWRDEQRVTRLIELVIAEFNAGRVKNGKLGAPNYESIAAIMSVDVPILDAQKIKTKLDNMRTEFRMFEDLKSRTGFGWDPETKTVKADVERWTELLQIEEKYAKFMGRGLNHYDELCYIFGNHTASGLYRYAPTQDPATTLGRSARSDLPRAASPFTPGEGSSGRRKRPSPTPSGVGSRKMRSGESQNDSFEEASKNFLRVRAERIANSNHSRISLVNECVDALMAIQPPIGEEAMGRAMDKIIQSGTFRQAFLRLSADARRAYVLYLK